VRNSGLQHRIAQKFEALVVVGTGAAVRQRTRQQRRLQEAITQPLLQCFEPAVDHHYCERPSPRYLMSRNTGS
jgi:hypothetical protein